MMYYDQVIQLQVPTPVGKRILFTLSSYLFYNFRETAPTIQPNCRFKAEAEILESSRNVTDSSGKCWYAQTRLRNCTCLQVFAQGDPQPTIWAAAIESVLSSTVSLGP